MIFFQIFAARGLKRIPLKGGVGHEIIDLNFFLLHEACAQMIPIWAPDSQAKIFSNMAWYF